MLIKSPILNAVYNSVCARNQGEEEFSAGGEGSASHTWNRFRSISARILSTAGIIDRIVEPERFIQFRYPGWTTAAKI